MVPDVVRSVVMAGGSMTVEVIAISPAIVVVGGAEMVEVEVIDPAIVVVGGDVIGGRDEEILMINTHSYMTLLSTHSGYL